jgi:microcystin-dependent protein
MSSPFVGEIRIFGFNFAPAGWALCDGQLLPLSQNTALFSLLGTMYGGDGKSTFALPDFQDTAPMMLGAGQGLSQRFQGETSGEQSVTLLQSEIPQHNHTMLAYSGGGDNVDPTGAAWSSAMVGRQGTNLFTPPQPTKPTNASGLALKTAGNSLPHNNMPPFLTLNFCIALQGIYPARS